jgi:hypothetical protein
MQSGKSSIAWFKLAEFTNRREKERALLFYRLLVHSINDEAVACQLEGDLYAAFNDQRALDCYRRAARMYTQTNKAEHAETLYELIKTLPFNTKPENAATLSVVPVVEEQPLV